MSFSAEPYGVFVDDLVSSLTGGVVREEFVFLEENAPFKLGLPPAAGTVRIHGLVGGAFFRFRDQTDFTVADDGTIAWLAADDPATPAAGASWPDRGTHFYASYERPPDAQSPPLLTDRNPGSVVRTLAESFAREYAVLSRQLELVYRGAFLETAEGRDLDQVVALVGVERRSRTVASGEVVFSRSTPAPADVFVPEGTLVSTGEVPAVTVATTEDRTLRSGTLSVAVPVQALEAGPGGVAIAGSLTVVHRPILGIEAATNPEAMTFGGGSETDDSLRRRASRALEASGRSTPGAITGALISVEGIREQDVRIEEDHLAFPGLVKVSVASDLTPEQSARAAQLIDEVRPAGIRVVHNLVVPPAASPPPTSDSNGEEPGPAPPVAPVEGIWFPVGVKAVVTPAAATLTAGQKSALTNAVEVAIGAFVESLGVGETIVYNRLVAAIVAVDGVYDVSLDLFPAAAVEQAGRRSLTPTPATTRPRLDLLDVTLRGALIALDVAVAIERTGLATTQDATQALEDARADVLNRLQALLAAPPAQIDRAALLGALPDTATYSVQDLSYTAEFVDEGLRISASNKELHPADDQQAWVRNVNVTEPVQTT
jgi:uncharacterized phage protein gp47/JayE